MSRVLAAAWSLASPFWRSSQRWPAIGLLAGIVAMNLGLVAISVLLTYWQNAFYNALGAKDWSAFIDLLLAWHVMPNGDVTPGFGPLLAVFVLLTVYALYLKQALQLRWRRWTTERHLERWLAGRSYYLMSLGVGGADNPDQRIAEDIDLFVESTLTLGVGLLRALVTLVSFVILLWSLSDTITVLGFAIPGYLVWLALLYAGAGTILTHFVSRPLIELNFVRQRAEADFRFSLVRLRENAESIAFYAGETSEKQGLTQLFSAIVTNWHALMSVTKRMTFFTSTYSQAALVFPLAIVAPAYFAGRMPLGGIFQTASAFVQVQTALSWIVENYARIAEWNATVSRLHGFLQAVEKAERFAGGPAIVAGTGERIAAEGLTVSLPDGRRLLDAATLSIAPGESVLLTGSSGAGKSTLLRVLAGIWPFGNGTVRLPEGRRMFLPQKPYMPSGNLRRVVSYPEAEAHYGDAAILATLRTVGLDHLTGLLDIRDNWSARLSGGELQRIALARALLFRPDWLILDEATANLDHDSEDLFYTLIETHLPQTTLLSVAHRSRARQSHKRIVNLSNQALSEA